MPERPGPHNSMCWGAAWGRPPAGHDSPPCCRCAPGCSLRAAAPLEASLCGCASLPAAASSVGAWLGTSGRQTQRGALLLPARLPLDHPAQLVCARPVAPLQAAGQWPPPPPPPPPQPRWVPPRAAATASRLHSPPSSGCCPLSLVHFHSRMASSSSSSSKSSGTSGRSSSNGASRCRRHSMVTTCWCASLPSLGHLLLECPCCCYSLVPQLLSARLLPASAHASAAHAACCSCRRRRCASSAPSTCRRPTGGTERRTRTSLRAASRPTAPASSTGAAAACGAA